MMAKRKKRRGKISKEETAQVALRQQLGHGHVLRPDEDGRPRIVVGFAGEPNNLEKESFTADGEAKVRFSRADPLKLMLREHKKKGGIEFQLYRAAECIRVDFARIEGSGVRVSAFFERVDSTSIPYVPVGAIEAAHKLRAVLGNLRRIEINLIHQVVILYRPLADLEKEGWGHRNYLGPRLREALEEVAYGYGLTTKGRDRA